MSFCRVVSRCLSQPSSNPRVPWVFSPDKTTRRARFAFLVAAPSAVMRRALLTARRKHTTRDLDSRRPRGTDLGGLGCACFELMSMWSFFLFYFRRSLRKILRWPSVHSGTIESMCSFFLVEGCVYVPGRGGLGVFGLVAGLALYGVICVSFVLATGW